MKEKNIFADFLSNEGLGTMMQPATINTYSMTIFLKVFRRFCMEDKRKLIVNSNQQMHLN